MERKATGRAAMTTPAGDFDADGLDSSWDGECSDLPDMPGLQVHRLDAAAQEMGEVPADEPSQRAMPKLGTGKRFAKLKSSLAAKGAHDPGALAAYIGRRKFGKAKFAKIAAKARGGASPAEPADSGRTEALAPYIRRFPLEDIHIRSSGDGRTLEAYAAEFGVPAEVRDQDGHYMEEIDPVAFNKAISDAAPQGSRRDWRVGVFFNHGMTIHGTPAEAFSMPVGIPLEIAADGHGVKTVTRYHRGDLEDKILERIAAGSLPGYSFTGHFRRSRPLIPRGGFRPDRYGNLPVVRRMESTFKEYGPTPFPIYEGAAVTGMRSDLLSAMAADPDLAMRMLAMLRGDSTPGEPLPPSGTPSPGLAAEDSHVIVRSGRSVKQEMNAARSAFLQRQHRS